MWKNKIIKNLAYYKFDDNYSSLPFKSIVLNVTLWELFATHDAEICASLLRSDFSKPFNGISLFSFFCG